MGETGFALFRHRGDGKFYRRFPSVWAGQFDVETVDVIPIGPSKNHQEQRDRCARWPRDLGDATPGYGQAVVYGACVFGEKCSGDYHLIQHPFAAAHVFGGLLIHAPL